jgi:ribosomal protein S18
VARGRKKGGLQINNISDREELTGMIINQINSLNKKIKSFKNEGIDEHFDYIKQIMSDDMAQFTEHGTMSKSKKFYSSKNTVWLKKTLSALHKINNHDYYGTTTKYHKEVTASFKAAQNYMEDYLNKKGYDKDFIFETVNSKDFFTKLFLEFKDVGKGYGSNQAIDKIALSYSNNDTGFTDEERDKVLNNIEYSKNVLKRIQEEKEAFEEFQNMRNGKKR